MNDILFIDGPKEGVAEKWHKQAGDLIHVSLPSPDCTHVKVTYEIYDNDGELCAILRKSSFNFFEGYKTALFAAVSHGYDKVWGVEKEIKKMLEYIRELSVTE